MADEDIPEDFLLHLYREKEELLRLSDELKLAWEEAVTRAFTNLECAGGPLRNPAELSCVEPTEKPSLMEHKDTLPQVISLGELEQQSEGSVVKMATSTPQKPTSDAGTAPCSADDTPEGSYAVNASSRPKRSSKYSKATTVGVLLAKGGARQQWHLKQLIQSYIDYIAGALVLVNSFALMLQLELEGRQAAFQIGLPEGADFQSLLPIFRVVDSVFVFIFLAELLLRIFVEQARFIKDVANMMDTILVTGGLVDIFVSMNAQAEDMVTLRFVTALKAFRAIRMVRSFRFFRGLRGLVKACQCCLPSLCWSMVLLAVFMCMGGLIMGNLLQDFIKDETKTMEDRQWVWTRYGTCYRATYTLYEMTFAGNWPVNARPIMEKVNQGFVIFYLLYITIIVFAVIRVISAIFLKDTLDEAHNDAQQLVLDRLKKKADYVQRLEGLFRTIDDSGQGMITEDRLKEILANPKVKAYFQTLEIDVHEGHALFHLLDNGDGEVTLDEFIDGLMRCKGPARAIDHVALQSDVRQLDAKLTKLVRYFKDVGLIRMTSDTHARRSQVEHLKVFRLDRQISGESDPLP